MGRSSKTIKKIKNDLIYLLIRGILLVVCTLSRKSALQLGTYLGRGAYFIIPKERKKAERGLCIAFGRTKSEAGIRRLARQVYIDLGKNAIDAMRLGVTSREELHRLVKAEGLEHVDAAIARGKGVILLAGHIGCWELDAAYIASLGYSLHVIAKPLYDNRLDQLLVKTRKRAGVRNIARRQNTRDILRTLKNGEIVGILIDQDTKVDGVFVDFFGKPAHTPTGAAVIAMKTGAPIVPITIHREPDDTHHVIIDTEIPLIQTGNTEEDRRINTERCMKALERRIQEHPSQWVWMHERWKTQPKEETESHA